MVAGLLEFAADPLARVLGQPALEIGTVRKAVMCDEHGAGSVIERRATKLRELLVLAEPLVGIGARHVDVRRRAFPIDQQVRAAVFLVGCESVLHLEFGPRWWWTARLRRKIGWQASAQPRPQDADDKVTL